ncbi:hypothetical protein PR048_033228 [Dryococelus australis]|uniref:Uncharacterized protein n=1 Tax=Dryococelus australis TaxID=614101 RepID=A0ABQ9G324_9NEOP|nr:hypothetical protein PR048_033228 [Dryococelus australis]
MNAVKYRVVPGMVWTNRTMVSSNTDTNRTGVLAVVDIDHNVLKTIGHSAAEVTLLVHDSREAWQTYCVPMAEVDQTHSSLEFSLPLNYIFNDLQAIDSTVYVQILGYQLHIGCLLSQWKAAIGPAFSRSCQTQTVQSSLLPTVSAKFSWLHKLPNTKRFLFTKSGQTLPLQTPEVRLPATGALATKVVKDLSVDSRRKGWGKEHAEDEGHLALAAHPGEGRACVMVHACGPPPPHFLHSDPRAIHGPLPAGLAAIPASGVHSRPATHRPLLGRTAPSRLRVDDTRAAIIISSATPVADDEPMMNVVETDSTPCVVWTNRSVVSGNAETNRIDVFIVVYTGALSDTRSVKLVTMDGKFRVHPVELESIPSGGRPLNFRPWESCRMMPLVGGFPRGSPVSPALAFHTHITSPSSAFKATVFKGRANPSTPLYSRLVYDSVLKNETCTYHPPLDKCWLEWMGGGRCARSGVDNREATFYRPACSGGEPEGATPPDGRESYELLPVGCRTGSPGAEHAHAHTHTHQPERELPRCGPGSLVKMSSGAGSRTRDLSFPLPPGHLVHRPSGDVTCERLLTLLKEGSRVTRLRVRFIASRSYLWKLILDSSTMRVQYGSYENSVSRIGNGKLRFKCTARLPPWQSGSIPGRVTPGFSEAGIVPHDAAGRLVFSGNSRFPRHCIPSLLHSQIISLSLALKTSLLTATQNSSLTHTRAILNSDVNTGQIVKITTLLRTSTEVTRDLLLAANQVVPKGICEFFRFLLMSPHVVAESKNSDGPVGDVGAGATEADNVGIGVLGTSAENFDGSIGDFVAITAE